MSPIPGDSRQDPHHPDDEDISIVAMENNIIIAGSSSDSAGEDEDNGHQGYQMLSQDPEELEDEDYNGLDTQEPESICTAGNDELQSDHVPPYLRVR